MGEQEHVPGRLSNGLVLNLKEVGQDAFVVLILNSSNAICVFKVPETIHPFFNCLPGFGSFTIPKEIQDWQSRQITTDFMKADQFSPVLLELLDNGSAA